MDTPEKTPATTIMVPFLEAHYELSIFCDNKMVPDFARLVIPDLGSEEIPEKYRPLILVSKEHLLTCLKLTYANDVEVFPNPLWAFLDVSKPHHMGFNVTQNFHDKPLNGDALKFFFEASFKFRDEVRLILDGADRKIPLQYRYLSLFKVIEIEFRGGAKWNYSAVDNFLDVYRKEFQELGYNSRPFSILHELRDKCAHIKTGAQDDVLGVTHLNFKEADRVEKLLPLFRDICRDLINQKVSGAFLVGTNRDTGNFKPLSSG